LTPGPLGGAPDDCRIADNRILCGTFFRSACCRAWRRGSSWLPELGQWAISVGATTLALEWPLLGDAAPRAAVAEFSAGDHLARHVSQDAPDYPAGVVALLSSSCADGTWENGWGPFVVLRHARCGRGAHFLGPRARAHRVRYWAPKNVKDATHSADTSSGPQKTRNRFDFRVMGRQTFGNEAKSIGP